MKLINQILVTWIVSAAVGFAGSVKSAYFTFTAGKTDGFANNGYEPATPSNLLRTYLQGRDLMNFDEPGNNTVIAHTFTDLPTGIIAAQLSFRVQAVSGGTCNDRIRLGFAGDANPEKFFSFLGAWNTTKISCNRSGIGPGQELLSNNSWGEGPQAISDYTFTIPLQAATIAGMNKKGYIDVWGEDDTKFDYLQLNLQTFPKPSNYVGTILAFGVLGAAKTIKRKQKKQETFNQ